MMASDDNGDRNDVSSFYTLIGNVQIKFYPYYFLLISITKYSSSHPLLFSLIYNVNKSTLKFNESF